MCHVLQFQWTRKALAAAAGMRPLCSCQTRNKWNPPRELGIRQLSLHSVSSVDVVLKGICARK